MHPRYRGGGAHWGLAADFALGYWTGIGVKRESATRDFFVEAREMRGEDEGFSAAQFSSFEE